MQETEAKDAQILDGLCDEAVTIRVQQGKKNIATHTITKTYREILTEHIFTLFNALNAGIAIALALVGAWSNTLFIAIILANVCIGIIQEFHAKKLVDQLSLLMVSKVSVMRNSQLQTLSVDQLVQDDIVVFTSGSQICCDAKIVQGSVEVNESLLTGESDAIHKKEGASLLSGSSIISGKVYAQIEHVGNDNYAVKLANEAKKLKTISSELLTSMKKVTKITSYLILPLGAILFFEAMYVRGDMLSIAVVSSAAGLLGMLPKGLVLLISVSLAAGVGKLAKAKVLVQDLYSLETLAHVDTLCLDKTGTITNGCMSVEEVLSLTDEYPDIATMIGSFLAYSDDNNATNQALREYYPENMQYKMIRQIPFSSLRKWSAVELDTVGTMIMGAPERLLQGKLPKAIQSAMEQGNRVIVVGISKDEVKKEEQLNNIQPLLAIILSDTIRNNAKETLAYFKQEGIHIKVISGDHAITVSAVAKKAGLENYASYIDMSTIDEQTDFLMLVNTYAVFGRVTPIQKKLLVEALQQQGHCVAMTGDGVNDLLALREADCSIAIAEGSDAARQISQVVLLDSDFSCLPDVLLEGRRVVNNVTRVASVFFIKTIYSVVLSIICAIGNFPFPFIPLQITLIDATIEAFPAFLTMLEPNTKAVKGKFLISVFQSALPNAIVIVVAILTLLGLSTFFGIHEQQAITMMYYIVAIVTMKTVILSCFPFTKLRLFVCVTMVASFTFAIFVLPNFLHLQVLPGKFYLVTIAISVIAIIVERMLHRICKSHIQKLKFA